MTVNLNKFPSKSEQARLVELKKYEQLNENDQLPVLKVHDVIKDQFKKAKDMVYLAHAIPARISEFFADFVSGDTDEMRVMSPTEVEKDQEFIDNLVYDNDLKETFSDYAEEQSQSGTVAFLGFVDDKDKYFIEQIPSDQYFPQPDGSVIIATWKDDPRYPSSVQKLLMTQHYQLDGEDVKIERQIFRASAQGVAVENVAYEEGLGHMGLEADDYPENDTIDGLGELPIRQADNGRRRKDGFGRSDYKLILPQLAELNERTTQRAVQFLKNLNAKMAIPSSMMDEDGKVEYTEAYVVDKEDIMPQFIVNANALMKEAEDHVMSEIKMIETITAVPMWALTRNTAHAESVESLKTRLFFAGRKSQKKRSKLKRAILDMIRIGAKMTSQSEDLQNTDAIIIFSDVMPEQMIDRVDAEAEMVRSGLTSKRSSMKRLHNYDDEDANEELKEITEEQQVAGFGEKEGAPTL